MAEKEQVRDMFDSIAGRYDLLNHLLSFGIDRRWRSIVVKWVKRGLTEGNAAQSAAQNRDQPVRILDVATGTGDLAIAMAKKLRGEGNATTAKDIKVTGMDLSPEMLKIGREKVGRDKRTEEIEMLEGDAKHLPFGEGEFDAVTCGFGVRNFEHLEKGLEEMYRVLQPSGGKIYILEFSMPGKGNWMGGLYRFYFRKILPVVGRIVSGDKGAYTYLPESVGEFPYGERFEQMLRKVGFREVASRKLTAGIATLYIGRKG